MPLLAGVTAEEDVASPPTGAKEISTGEAQRMVSTQAMIPGGEQFE